MELFELRYFLEVAKLENIHRASERLNVSPGSLSKAIARLENELDVLLFQREGRSIKITNEGKLLKIRAEELLKLEHKTKQEITGKEGNIHAIICGPEILLSTIGPQVAEKIEKKNANTQFEFLSLDEDAILNKINNGEAHLALSTQDIPNYLSSKKLLDAKFQTVVGKGHPLYSKSKDNIPVETVLKYSFVSTSHPLFGKVGKRQSSDGWRDDEFPRKISYLTSSLQLLIQLVQEGKAIAYLPDYLVKNLNVSILKITGCPYTCVQSIQLIARKPEDRAWTKQLFSR